MRFRNLMPFNESKKLSLSYNSLPLVGAYVCIKDTNSREFNYIPGEAFQYYKYGDNRLDITNLQTQRSRTWDFDYLKRYIKPGSMYFKLAENDFSVQSDSPHYTSRIYYNRDGYFHREDGPACVTGNGKDKYYLNGNEVKKRAIESLIIKKRAIDRKEEFKELTIDILEELMQDISDLVIDPYLKFENYYTFKFNSISDKGEYYSELGILIKKLKVYGFDIDVRSTELEIYPI